MASSGAVGAIPTGPPLWWWLGVLGRCAPWKHPQTLPLVTAAPGMGQYMCICIYSWYAPSDEDTARVAQNKRSKFWDETRRAIFTSPLLDTVDCEMHGCRCSWYLRCTHYIWSNRSVKRYLHMCLHISKNYAWEWSRMAAKTCSYTHPLYLYIYTFQANKHRILLTTYRCNKRHIHGCSIPHSCHLYHIVTWVHISFSMYMYLYTCIRRGHQGEEFWPCVGSRSRKYPNAEKTDQNHSLLKKRVPAERSPPSPSLHGPPNFVLLVFIVFWCLLWGFDWFC